MFFVEREILRIEKGARTARTDRVIREDKVRLYYGDTPLGTYSCTRKELRALALGFARSAGYPVGPGTPVLEDGDRLVIGEAPGGSPLSPAAEPDGVRVAAEEVLAAMEQLRRESALFLQTGGTHNGGFLSGGRLVHPTEDISRHCMVDKLMGKALLETLDLSVCPVLLSCRITESIMEKLLPCHVALVFSMSAPMDRAIGMAEQAGVTLAGFVRGDRMNVYAHPHRIG